MAEKTTKRRTRRPTQNRDAQDRTHALASVPEKPTDADVAGAWGIMTDPKKQTTYDWTHSKEILRTAPRKQKDRVIQDMGDRSNGTDTRDRRKYSNGRK